MAVWYLDVTVFVNDVNMYSKRLTNGMEVTNNGRSGINSIAIPEIITDAREGANTMKVVLDARLTGNGVLGIGDTSVVFTGVLR